MLLLGVFVFIFGIIYFYVKRRYSYWSSRGVNQLQPRWFFGDLDYTKALDILYHEHYLKFKAQGVKFGGYYDSLKPNLMVLEPEIIKLILIKDFDHFRNHRKVFVNEKDPLAQILPVLADERWKSLRSKLSPAFTSGKMKMMFETIIECTETFKGVLSDCATSKEAVNIKSLLSKFTMEIIGSCAFGLDCGTMRNPDSEFTRIINSVFKPSKSKQFMLNISRYIIPLTVLKLLNIHMVTKEVESFFVNLVKDIIKYRENNNVFRKDFMHLMIQLKNRGEVNDNEIENIKDKNGATKSYLTDYEVTAQCFIFFMAGFETSSTAMTFAFYELAVNQHVQDKLRKEINNVLMKHDNKLSHEAVADMKYLDQVIKETLRIHPPAGHTSRLCNKDYKIPNTNVTIKEGIIANIPILGLHMDEKYYPNPEKFEPNRFTEKEIAKRPGCTWLPFGDGPRNCIGLRFALLQSKVGLITLLKDFKVTLNSKTKTPLKLNPGSTIASVIGGIWLNLHKIEQC